MCGVMVFSDRYCDLELPLPSLFASSSLLLRFLTMMWMAKYSLNSRWIYRDFKPRVMPASTGFVQSTKVFPLKRSPSKILWLTWKGVARKTKSLWSIASWMGVILKDVLLASAFCTLSDDSLLVAMIISWPSFCNLLAIANPTFPMPINAIFIFYCFLLLFELLMLSKMSYCFLKTILSDQCI